MLIRKGELTRTGLVGLSMCTGFLMGALLTDAARHKQKMQIIDLREGCYQADPNGNKLQFRPQRSIKWYVDPLPKDVG
jgi:hypothetical protein